MSSIEKLAIVNVRSFGANSKDNIIEFYKPLTVIVGHNGAGKTTIIECLKYATSGDMPPNCSNGQAFVQDPKIAGTREIAAQIRLKFRNVKGEPFVVIRSMQLTQKTGAKLEFKSKEGTIQMIRNKQRISQSHRCADIDMLIPQFLGVSKAILNSVIFCHQEESNWPLMEKNKVKQKFDDLFCASRYNKALAEIKEQKKKLNQEVRETKIKLEGIQQQKDQADQFKEDLTNFRRELETATEQIAKFKEEMQTQTTIVQECTKLERAARDTIQKIEALRSEKQFLIKNHQRFEKTLKEVYLETDEELEEIKRNFDAEIKKLHELKKRNESSVAPLRSQKEKASKVLQRYDSELRDTETRLKHAKQNFTKRDQAVRQFAVDYEITLECASAEGFISTENVTHFSMTATTKLESISQEIQAIRVLIKSKNDEFSSSSGSLTSEIGSLSSSISRNKKKLAENKKQIGNHEAQIQSNTSLISKMEQFEKAVKEKEQELAALQAEQNTNTYEQQISSLSAEKEENEQEAQKISGIISTLTRHTTLISRIEASENNANQIKTEFSSKLDKLVLECSIYLSGVKTGEGDPSSVERKIKSKIEDERSSVSVLEKTLKKYRTEFSTSNGKLSANSDSLKKLRSSLEMHKRKLSAFDKPLPELIAQAEKTMQARQKDITMAKSAEIIYKNFIEQGTKEKECPLCERSMEEDALSDLMSKLSLTLQKVPERLTENRIALKEAEAELKQLKKLLPNWNEFERLSKEIPKLEATQSELEALTKQHSEQLQHCEQEHKVKTELLHTLQTHHSAVQDIIKEHKRYSSLLSQIDSMKSQLPSDGASDLTMDDANEKLELLRNKNKEISTKLAELRKNEKSCQSRITLCLNAINSTKSKLLQATNSAQEIENLRKKLNDLKSENEGLVASITSETEQHQSNSKILMEKKQIHDKEIKQLEKQERTAQQTRDQFNSALLHLKNAIKQTEGILLEDLQEALKKQHEKKEKAQKLLDETEQKIIELEGSLKVIDTKLNTSDSAKRNLEDNLQFREQKKAIEAKDEEIAALEAASTTPPKSVLTNKAKAETNLKKITAKYDSLMGMRGVYQSQAAKIEKDLSKPVYKNVDAQFKEMKVKLTSTVMAIEDLDRYYNALDKAIMQYHAMKMEEINKILKELWQSTYKGSDIDSIELRADSEGKGRTYNYRLIMVKGDSELDMRGRCSAGQKVLASLVIRLALADSLGVNCGIIALDEPTTNLDRENVESFASALVDLIDVRSRQGNFQLIVITHDEEFVQLLGRSERAEHYWRVTKDINQHSRVEKCDIADLA